MYNPTTDDEEWEQWNAQRSAASVNNQSHQMNLNQQNLNLGHQQTQLTQPLGAPPLTTPLGSVPGGLPLSAPLGTTVVPSQQPQQQVGTIHLGGLGNNRPGGPHGPTVVTVQGQSSYFQQQGVTSTSSGLHQHGNGNYNHNQRQQQQHHGGHTNSNNSNNSNRPSGLSIGNSKLFQNSNNGFQQQGRHGGGNYHGQHGGHGGKGHSYNNNNNNGNPNFNNRKNQQQHHGGGLGGQANHHSGHDQHSSFNSQQNQNQYKSMSQSQQGPHTTQSQTQTQTTVLASSDNLNKFQNSNTNITSTSSLHLQPSTSLSSMPGNITVIGSSSGPTSYQYTTSDFTSSSKSQQQSQQLQVQGQQQQNHLNLANKSQSMSNQQSLNQLHSTTSSLPSPQINMTTHNSLVQNLTTSFNNASDNQATTTNQGTGKPLSISRDYSSEAMKQQTCRLLQQLDQDFPLLTEDQIKERNQIRDKIEDCLNKWLGSVKARGQGRVRSMGSFPLGVATIASDMDLVCFIPSLNRFCWNSNLNSQYSSPRDFWFHKFGDKLKQLEDVSDFVRIQGTNPCLACKMRGIDLDILLCDTPMDTVPESFFPEPRFRFPQPRGEYVTYYQNNNSSSNSKQQIQNQSNSIPGAVTVVPNNNLSSSSSSTAAAAAAFIVPPPQSQQAPAAKVSTKSMDSSPTAREDGTSTENENTSSNTNNSSKSSNFNHEQSQMHNNIKSQGQPGQQQQQNHYLREIYVPNAPWTTLVYEDKNLFADDILRGLDDLSMRSMNGVRISRLFLCPQSVPDVEKFKQVLRFIKAWAKKRGILSNICGYWGGISWAICVAKVCQMYPNHCVAQLVLDFFKTMNSWDWNRDTLCCSAKLNPKDGYHEARRREYLIHPTFEDQRNKNLSTKDVFKCIPNIHNFNLSSYFPSQRPVMAVATPLFPSQNSCFNTNKYNKMVLDEQFFTASVQARMMERLIESGALNKEKNKMENKDSIDSNNDMNKNESEDESNIQLYDSDICWSDFYQPISFFSDYVNYMRIDSRSKTLERHNIFKGFIESKLRQLLIQLDNVNCRGHLYPYDLAQFNDHIEDDVSGLAVTSKVTFNDYRQHKEDSQGKLGTTVAGVTNTNLNTTNVEQKEISSLSNVTSQNASPDGKTKAVTSGVNELTLNDANTVTNSAAPGPSSSGDESSNQNLDHHMNDHGGVLSSTSSIGGDLQQQGANNNSLSLSQTQQNQKGFPYVSSWYIGFQYEVVPGQQQKVNSTAVSLSKSTALTTGTVAAAQQVKAEEVQEVANTTATAVVTTEGTVTAQQTVTESAAAAGIADSSDHSDVNMSSDDNVNDKVNGSEADADANLNATTSATAKESTDNAANVPESESTVTKENTNQNLTATATDGTDVAAAPATSTSEEEKKNFYSGCDLRYCMGQFINFLIFEVQTTKEVKLSFKSFSPNTLPQGIKKNFVDPLQEQDMARKERIERIRKYFEKEKKKNQLNLKTNSSNVTVTDLNTNRISSSPVPVTTQTVTVAKPTLPTQPTTTTDSSAVTIKEKDHPQQPHGTTTPIPSVASSSATSSHNRNIKTTGLPAPAPAPSPEIEGEVVTQTDEEKILDVEGGPPMKKASEDCDGPPTKKVKIE